jgi:transposase-like protein
MGQVLHRGATTTEAIRRAIQHSQESLRALSRRHGINPKTVAKWRKRCSVADLPTGPKTPRSTVLTVEQEAIIVAVRKHTLLPHDDCLYALQVTIPKLTRSSLHRCLERHGISRLPEVEGDKPRRKKFDSITTATAGPSSGQPRPTPSSRNSPNYVHVFPGRHTSENNTTSYRCCSDPLKRV